MLTDCRSVVAGEWEVDLTLAPGTMMTETLIELEFKTATGEGQAVYVLMAADYHWEGTTKDRRFVVSAYVRNSLTGLWNQTVVATGPISRVQESGGSLSLRAACVHRDSVTKEERVFILVSILHAASPPVAFGV